MNTSHKAMILHRTYKELKEQYDQLIEQFVDFQKQSNTMQFSIERYAGAGVNAYLITILGQQVIFNMKMVKSEHPEYDYVAEISVTNIPKPQNTLAIFCLTIYGSVFNNTPSENNYKTALAHGNAASLLIACISVALFE